MRRTFSGAASLLGRMTWVPCRKTVPMRLDLQEILPDTVLFVAVARAQSFSRAAKTLRMPVATVSRRVASLEKRLGVSLFHRTTRQVALTSTGARYLAHAQLIIDAAEAAHADLVGDAESPRGTLRISTTQDFALTYLWPVLRSFSTRYPEVSFNIDFSSRIVDLIAEGFDVAIRLGPLPDSQLHARRLGVGSLGLYAAPAYLAKAGMPSRPSELSAHDCIRIHGEPDKASRWTLSCGTDVEVVEVKGRFVATGMRFLVELAAAGAGIALLDDTIAQEAATSGLLRRVLPCWQPAPVPVHALTPSKLLPARTRRFLECLREHLQLKESPPVDPLP